MRAGSFKRLLGRPLKRSFRRGHVPPKTITKIVEARLTNPPILVLGCIASVQRVRQQRCECEIRPAELTMVVIPCRAPLTVRAPMKHDTREVLRVVISDPPVVFVCQIRTPPHITRGGLTDCA